MMQTDFELDTTGMACPVPIVKTAKKMREMTLGQTLKIISDDDGFRADIVAWCESTGNEFIQLDEEGGKLIGYVRKAT
jgi:TusA-related sulfurtransferase